MKSRLGNMQMRLQKRRAGNMGREAVWCAGKKVALESDTPGLCFLFHPLAAL